MSDPRRFPEYNPLTHFIDAKDRPAPLLVRKVDGVPEYVLAGTRWFALQTGPVMALAEPAQIRLEIEVKPPPD